MYSKQSDTESNVSGFINYSEDNIKRLYTSAIEVIPTIEKNKLFYLCNFIVYNLCLIFPSQNIQLINEDILEVQKNLKAIVKNSGHLEKQVTALLLALPQPSVSLSMEE